MKLTESQLRILVKEEIDQMVDEGLFDFIKGAAKPAVDAAKAAGSNIKKFAKKSWRSGKLSSVAGDLETASRIVHKLVVKAMKLAEEIPDEDVKKNVVNRLKHIKGGATSAATGAGQIRAQMEE